MKKPDFTKETDEGLMNTLTEMREGVRSFRFSTAGSVARDVKTLRVNKKGIARILTEQNARARAVHN